MAESYSNRQKQILQKLEQSGEISIQLLADSLSVSTMTIHRDLNRLESAGLVVKKHGSVALSNTRGAPDNNSCAMCGRAVNERTVFTLSLTNGEQLRACCAHCGLMLQQKIGDVWQSMTTDFLHGHVVSTSQATFLIGNELTICCAPSVLTFGNRKDAERFQMGFGGKIAGMEETLEYLHGMMHAKKMA
jgi:DeoR/GlpR family transcriptional regulator of sugar metabolism